MGDSEGCVWGDVAMIRYLSIKMYFSSVAGYIAESAKNTIIKALRGELLKKYGKNKLQLAQKKSANDTTTLQVTTYAAPSDLAGKL